MTIPVRFCRKPTSLDEVQAAANDPQSHVYDTEVVETRDVSTAEYDHFTSSFMHNRSWLEGNGGITDHEMRQAIALSAPDRVTLYIDPSGYSYARYVGMAAPADSTPVEKRPYSVLLLYPDYVNYDGEETYYTFVMACDPIEAIVVAQREAVAAQDGVVFPPDDFHPLLVTQGHHTSEPLFNN